MGDPSNDRLAVILLAGLGSRLGRPKPKSLTELTSGETILGRQLRILADAGFTVCAVVGFKKDLIMEAAPGILYAYNPDYDATNTAKSLLVGLENFRDRDVLWLNGDVVFEPEILERVLSAGGSCVAVNKERVGEEEVKYTLNSEGFIDQISKVVEAPLGEALGINYVAAEHLEAFKAKLEEAADDDYFERAMELLIGAEGNVFREVDVSDLACIEVDFKQDLDNANSMLRELPASGA